MRVISAILLGSTLVSCEEKETAVAVAKTPPAVVTREPEIPAVAERLKIHWKMKLPHMAKGVGEHVIRDRDALEALFRRACGEERARLYQKWNGIDFGREMAVIAVEEHSTYGYDHEIQAVWKAGAEIVVEILAHYPAPGSVVPQAFSWPASGVVIARSDLPVRFVWHRKAG